jgi:hypothetical protein
MLPAVDTDLLTEENTAFMTLHSGPVSQFWTGGKVFERRATSTNYRFFVVGTGIKDNTGLGLVPDPSFDRRTRYLVFEVGSCRKIATSGRWP